eukprot:TRINITY_DN50178_c0_g2_i1.p1 TRINITY_DN50178_c0_g2~~TRINITY_DN50178_c0_g2_i1.p1  ORF type:complete len:315 (-),score=58.62 TRINITY_DN50178_c0_g2_i1:49-993(-)
MSWPNLIAWSPDVLNCCWKRTVGPNDAGPCSGCGKEKCVAKPSVQEVSLLRQTVAARRHFANLLPAPERRGPRWPLSWPPGGAGDPYTVDGRLKRLRDAAATRGPPVPLPLAVFEAGEKKVVRGGAAEVLQVFWVDCCTCWGVRTTTALKAGAFVCEYAGEVISDEDAEARCAQQEGSALDRDAYLFNLTTPQHWRDLGAAPGGLDGVAHDADLPGFVVDAYRNGSIARYVNHACGPSEAANLTPIFVFTRDSPEDATDARFPRVALFANRNIQSWEELRYDYEMFHGSVADGAGGDRHLKCFCRSSHCRGWIY